jgi:hypothetical protein
MNRLLPTLCVLACVALAQGAITVSFVRVPDVPYCFDLVVTVTDDGSDPDDWTCCGMTATLAGGVTFIDDYTYNPSTPNWGLGDPYDSFFTCPQGWPNCPECMCCCVAFADPAAVIEEPQLRFGEWFDMVDTGAGTYVLHRLRLDVTGSGWLVVEGAVGAANTGGQLVPFYFDSSLAPCLGDLDFDWDIDLSDLAQLLANYGMTTGATYQNGDLDADEDVDLEDLAELLSVYGANCS